MTLAALPNLIFAQTTDDSAGQVVYELARLRAMDDERLPLVLLVLAVTVILGVVWYLYRRDSIELARPLGIGLALLRTVALVGLLVFFLGIERRTTHEVVHNSQVAMLVDVSLSMGIADDEAQSAGPSRMDQVLSLLTDSPLLAELRQRHDVNVAGFDRSVEPVVSLPLEAQGGDQGDEKRDRSIVDATDEPPQTSDDNNGPVPFFESLQPRGTETRIGQALDEQLRLYRGAPLAGVVLLTDGAQNSGVEPSAAVEAAKAQNVPIFTIGFGATEPLRNLAIRDLVMPTRAFPNDTLNVTGYLQSHGYAGRLVEVQLSRRRSTDPEGSLTPIDSERVVLGTDGEMTPVSFDVEPAEPGTYVYQLSVAPPADDGNPRDNHREAEVDVVDRQTQVLIVAGGPSRDYRFLRDQLHRDPTMTVDVLLQTAQPGMSQDANRILAEFPSTREELYQYDCIVALDPDWTELDAGQVALLETWVSEEAGGLIAVAGPIHTARWIRSTEHAKLRDLYPVVFQQRMTLLDDGQFASDTPWPLEFERAGREARFLWLENSAEDNERAWDSFVGVYGYFAIRGEKPGATVYARFSDPEAGLSSQRPVYLADQFYGAGRVLYVGSAELWRLRTLRPEYFEVLTTKLIRHASQGRILRGSSRGALLVERDRYELGETVVLRARLADAQHQPLTEQSVTVQVLRPDGTAESVNLTADDSRPGMYVGQVAVLQEGTYQISLPLARTGDELLSRYLQVRVPDRERSQAQRDEALLASLAEETGGKYYGRLDAVLDGDDGLPPLAEAIESRAEVKLLKGAPDQEFAQMQMRWLLGVIAGALFLEWIVRRLNRLA